jgi:hypothetical protein
VFLLNGAVHRVRSAAHLSERRAAGPLQQRSEESQGFERGHPLYIPRIQRQREISDVRAKRIAQYQKERHRDQELIEQLGVNARRYHDRHRRAALSACSHEADVLELGR